MDIVAMDTMTYTTLATLCLVVVALPFVMADSVTLGDGFMFNYTMKELRAESEMRINGLNGDNKDYIRELVAEVKNASEQLIQRRIGNQLTATQEEFDGLNMELHQNLDTKFREIEGRLKTMVDTMINNVRQSAKKNNREAINQNSTCPHGWVEMEQKCVFRVEYQKKWQDAQKYCKQYKPNGRLVELMNLKETFDVREMQWWNLYRYPWIEEGYWIGMTDLNGDGIYGLPSRKRPYFRWLSGNPNNQLGFPGCGCIGWSTEAYMADNDCRDKLEFICAIDKVPIPGQR